MTPPHSQLIDRPFVERFTLRQGDSNSAKTHLMTYLSERKPMISESDNAWKLSSYIYTKSGGILRFQCEGLVNPFCAKKMSYDLVEDAGSHMQFIIIGGD
jgi:hypothetical protein